jgi:hypothetical protein
MNFKETRQVRVKKNDLAKEWENLRVLVHIVREPQVT